MPVDVLVIAFAGDGAATPWMPELLRMWAVIEEGNMTIPALEDDVMLPAPPPSPEAPPSYEEAVSTTTNVVEIISDDEEDDDSVFVN